MTQVRLLLKEPPSGVPKDKGVVVVSLPIPIEEARKRCEEILREYPDIYKACEVSG